MSFYVIGFAYLAFALPPTNSNAPKGFAVFAGLCTGSGWAASDDAGPGGSVKPFSNLYPQVIPQLQNRHPETVKASVVLMARPTPLHQSTALSGGRMPVFGIRPLCAARRCWWIFRFIRTKRFRVITGGPPRLEEYSAYFASVRGLEFVQDGVQFSRGRRHRLSPLRDGVLGVIYKRFYNNDLPRSR
jgi:hypothetical protein